MCLQAKRKLLQEGKGLGRWKQASGHEEKWRAQETGFSTQTSKCAGTQQGRGWDMDFVISPSQFHPGVRLWERG